MDNKLLNIDTNIYFKIFLTNNKLQNKNLKNISNDLNNSLSNTLNINGLNEEINKKIDNELNNEIDREIYDILDSMLDNISSNVSDSISSNVSDSVSCNVSDSVILNKLNNENITISNLNDKRYYKIINDYFPSVTSIIKIVNEKAINNWKKKIGIEKSNLICKTATERGTRIHTLCENYLKKKILSYEYEIDKKFFKQFINELDKISNIHLIEKCLYSKKYKYAGTVDCIAEYNNVLSIIDFKTSSKLKKKEYITSYFIQTAAYSIAYEEMTNCKIENLVIIIGIDNSEKTQIFIENINNKNEYNKSWSEQFLYLNDLHNKNV